MFPPQRPQDMLHVPGPAGVDGKPFLVAGVVPALKQFVRERTQVLLGVHDETVLALEHLVEEDVGRGEGRPSVPQLDNEVDLRRQLRHAVQCLRLVALELGKGDPVIGEFPSRLERCSSSCCCCCVRVLRESGHNFLFQCARRHGCVHLVRSLSVLSKNVGQKK